MNSNNNLENLKNENPHLMNQDECEQVSKVLGLTPNTHSETLVDDLDSNTAKKLAQLTQHKKNIYLLEAAKAGSFDEVVKIVNAGADILAQERAYPNYTALDLAINYGQNPQLIFFLFAQGAPLKLQFIKKKISTVDPITHVASSTTTTQVDYSQSFWNSKWEQCVSSLSASTLGTLIDSVSDCQEAWAQECKTFMPKKTSLLALYAKNSNWVDAKEAMIKFGGSISTQNWHKYFNYLNLNYIFANYNTNVPHAIVKRAAISEIILAHKQHFDQKSVEELYTLSIINDAEDLLKTMLKTFLKPSDDWKIPIGTDSFFSRNNSNLLAKKENVLLVALQHNSERCLKTLWSIPSILTKLKSSTINPENITNLRVSDLQKIEELGANIDSIDSDGNNFLHHYANKTSESVVGWSTLARWKSELLNAPNNNNETPIDIMTRRIKSLDRRLVSYNSQVEEILSAFQKTVARAEATVLRKELKTSAPKTKTKKIKTKAL